MPKTRHGGIAAASIAFSDFSPLAGALCDRDSASTLDAMGNNPIDR
jgi:hypothetical protein